jgi:hypothetical protein
MEARTSSKVVKGTFEGLLGVYSLAQNLNALVS